MEPEGSAPKKKRQIDRAAFFEARSKVKPNYNRHPNNSSSIDEQQKKDSARTTSTRTLHTLTAEKWKSTSLAKYNILMTGL